MNRKEKSLFEFCPYCGASTFITSNQGRSYTCGSCNFHYFINNSAAVACLLFNSNGELLLTRRAFDPAKGMLDLPGGFVEPMETAEEAVDREIKEELNILITKKTYLTSFPNLYPYSEFNVPTVDLAFICETDQWDSLTPGDDVASTEFVMPENIVLNDLYSQSMKQIIRYYIENYSK
jgi:mutator protein MutT